MPAASPNLTHEAAERLKALGGVLRSQRKRLSLSAVAAAEAAGISRVTLHRIERGEASVTIGAWVSAALCIGLDFRIEDPRDARAQIPASIRLADYPQLRELAWHVQGTGDLTPAEALAVYERNRRHLDLNAMSPNERQLLEALRAALAPPKRDV